MLSPTTLFSSHFVTKSNNLLSYRTPLSSDLKSFKSCVTINYEDDNTTRNSFISFKSTYEAKMCFFDCSKFNNYELFDTIAMSSICPLKGTVNKAIVYMNKEFTTNGPEKISIFMEGCFFIQPNGSKEEVTWIVNPYSIKDFLKYKKSLKQFTTTTNITFDNLNSNCDHLCTKHTPVCLTDEKKFDENLHSEINFNGLIYFISILCLTFFGYLIFNYLKNKFNKRIVATIN